MLIWEEKGAHMEMLLWKQGYPAIVTGIVTLLLRHFLTCPFSLWWTIRNINSGVRYPGIKIRNENVQGLNVGSKWLGLKYPGLCWIILQPFPISVLQEFQNILLSLHFGKVIKISFRGFNHCTSLSDFVQIVWKLIF